MKHKKKKGKSKWSKKKKIKNKKKRKIKEKRRIRKKKKKREKLTCLVFHGPSLGTMGLYLLANAAGVRGMERGKHRLGEREKYRTTERGKHRRSARVRTFGPEEFRCNLRRHLRRRLHLHYPNPLFYRAPEVLLSVFFQALSKEGFTESQIKNTRQSLCTRQRRLCRVKKITQQRLLCRVPK
jgi:hypothetical protein